MFCFNYWNFQLSINGGYVKYLSFNNCCQMFTYKTVSTFFLLTLLHFFLPILNLQFFLLLYINRKNIWIGGTNTYIFTSVIFNTTLHFYFYAFATICYISCLLIFIFTIQKYVLNSIFLSWNSMESDFFTWGRIQNAHFNYIWKSHELGDGLISVQNSVFYLNTIKFIKALNNLAKYMFVVCWSAIQCRYCNISFISNGKYYDRLLFTILINWMFIYVKLIGINMSFKTLKWFCNLVKKIWI